MTSRELLVLRHNGNIDDASSALEALAAGDLSLVRGFLKAIKGNSELALKEIPE
jgi:hypothetical protein